MGEMDEPSEEAGEKSLTPALLAELWAAARNRQAPSDPELAAFQKALG